MIIALAGNPNCGKTTLFNALTGAHQSVGNWPGVTVEKKSGQFHLDDTSVELVDLPGIYSLEQQQAGIDEEIARSFLANSEVDLLVNIVDASNLQRNLILTQQLLELDVPVIVALNMLDVARQQGTAVDAQALQTRLGVPVVPIIASRGEGLSALKVAMTGPTSRQQAAALPQTEVNERLSARYYKAQELTDGVVEMRPGSHSLTERIDGWVLHPWLGIPVFLLMMYLMFTIAINVGAVFIDFFDILFAAFFVDLPAELLAGIGAPGWLTVLVANGLGGGIQLVATFVPVIGCLFLCLSFLEDSGYMSRAAFVIDRLMAGIGLPGNAFVPLIVGFGCNVPAVMAARSLGRDNDRLMTIAMAPFMSCGARLTVYALFAAAFFPSNGQNVVFFLYLLGIAMAVFTGWIFRRQIFSGEVSHSFQEMPAYHIPVLRNLLLTSWFRLRSFVVRAGKTIIAVVVVLSFLNSLGTDGSFGNEDSERSMLARIGMAITPVFSPLGVSEDNWPATVGLFTGLFAKEAVVGTLDALYSGTADEAAELDLLASTAAAFTSIGDNLVGLAGSLVDPLGLDISGAQEDVDNTTLSAMAAAFGTQFAAFCYLVFVLLYAPCVAVLGAVAKEAGLRWMLLVFAWTTGLGYLTATSLYQIGTFMAHPLFSGLWLLGSLSAFLLFVTMLRRIAGQPARQADLIAVVQVG